ncbi:hypothetical protein F5X99DRAFT_371102 [Biscogniauxia marginata]|nr:hypothetical protein F5X99DRAFT_371102 [Biscogniauxia marginata]
MTGRHGPRSKNGCSTCRIRKVKCDEQRPTCGGCRRMQFTCDWLRLGVVPNTRHYGNSRSVQESCDSTKLRPLKPAIHNATSKDPQDPTDNLETCENSKLGINSRSRLLSSCARLLPSLSPPNIPCSNSIILARHDRIFLEYFPASTIHYAHSPRKWGPLQYLCEVTALSSSMVMRMMLAISASEMRRRGLYTTLQGSRPDFGLYHYTTALQELQNCITTQGIEYREEVIDEILATIFFMIQYGLQSTPLLSHVKAHIIGARSLVTSYVRSLNQTGRRKKGNTTISLPPLSSRLLLWILYTDVSGTWLETSNELMKLFGNPSSSSLSLAQLYKDARFISSTLWGDEYPVDCRVDDVQNLRPFEFVHRLHMIRSKIWKSRTNARSGDITHIYSSLMKELMLLQEIYHELFEKACADSNTSFRSVHTPKTTSRLIANYWACVLFCRRWLCPSSSMDTIHHHAIAFIVECISDQYKKEKRRLLRFIWPMFMAAIETQDSAHRDWLLERLAENRNTSAECEWSWNVAREIAKLQSRPDRSCVDLSRFVQFMDNESK